MTSTACFFYNLIGILHFCIHVSETSDKMHPLTCFMFVSLKTKTVVALAPKIQIYLAKIVCDNYKTLLFRSPCLEVLCKKNGSCNGDSLMHPILSCAYYYLVQKNRLTSHQSGNRKLHSTETLSLLVHVTDHIFRAKSQPWYWLT